MSGRIRCAIYTRKSSEEGLEQSFNSLDAQREACEAFVKSQQHEGWQAIPTHYDDGGFSGGNMVRPALKKLMADIEQGKVDTVVVYKVDRLTRSLADFAKIIENFDAKQVSFVSVTQQFNTTSSMGRLTLNVLLSFAQFEREVTGERIRDKIAASKKKGMWMGGSVPLGYDLRERSIYINPSEAETIRSIYSNYLRLGYVMALKEYLDSNGIRSKPRTRGGSKTGDSNFSRGALHRILRNHIYVGEIKHKDAVYRGQHEAIIEREQWTEVQKLLDQNRQGDPRKSRATKVSLFTGIIFDPTGNRYTPSHAIKSGRRYRYYTSQAVIRKTTKTDEPARIPAHDLEAAVIKRILEFLKSPREVLRMLVPVAKKAASNKYTELLRRASEKAANWNELSAENRERFIKAILERIVVHSDELEILIRKRILIQNLLGNGPVQPTAARETHSLRCPFRHAHQRKALRLVIGASDSSGTNSVAILKAVSQARAWQQQLISSEAQGIKHLAKLNHLRVTTVRKILQFGFLSPNSIEAILAGQVAPDLTFDFLVGRISVVWKEQGALMIPSMLQANKSLMNSLRL
jgi:DNA invertase Pin-like site-specific DNA recombinase